MARRPGRILLAIKRISGPGCSGCGVVLWEQVAQVGRWLSITRMLILENETDKKINMCKKKKKNERKRRAMCSIALKGWAVANTPARYSASGSLGPEPLCRHIGSRALDIKEVQDKCLLPSTRYSVVDPGPAHGGFGSNHASSRLLALGMNDTNECFRNHPSGAYACTVPLPPPSSEATVVTPSCQHPVRVGASAPGTGGEQDRGHHHDLTMLPDYAK
ncbi:hypothetical protein BD779DRAFT_1465977 [Infundibulicybe gibba]|nr:hypothetical protein BD779DRAFT_1465977 [Infundibulicybe gibba]